MRTILLLAFLGSVPLVAQGTTFLEFIQIVCSVPGPVGSVHYRPLFCTFFRDEEDSSAAESNDRETYICTGLLASKTTCSELQTCPLTFDVETEIAKAIDCEVGDDCFGPFLCDPARKCPAEVLARNPNARCRLLKD